VLNIKNKRIKKSVIIFLYKKLKKDKGTLFNRQTNIYIDLLNLAFLYSFSKNNFKALGSMIVKIFFFTQKRNHAKFFRFLKKLFRLLIITLKRKTNKLMGIKIQIKGRLKGKPRAKKFVMGIKSVPVQRLNLTIEYHDETAMTIKHGTFGFKFWVLTRKMSESKQNKLMDAVRVT
jgi:hypothetical protein